MPASPPIRGHAAFPAGELPLLSLVGVATASFWRGTWFMMDAALLPEDARASALASFCVGFGGFAALHQGTTEARARSGSTATPLRVSASRATLRAASPRAGCAF